MKCVRWRVIQRWHLGDVLAQREPMAVLAEKPGAASPSWPAWTRCCSLSRLTTLWQALLQAAFGARWRYIVAYCDLEGQFLPSSRSQTQI